MRMTPARTQPGTPDTVNSGAPGYHVRMRLLRTTVLLVVAIAAGLLAWGALSNLWSDYQDSETSTYLLYGVPSLLVALAALFAAARLWRGDRR